PVRLAVTATDAEPATAQPYQQWQVDDHREVPAYPPAGVAPRPRADPGPDHADALRAVRDPVLRCAAGRPRCTASTPPAPRRVGAGRTVAAPCRRRARARGRRA